MFKIGGLAREAHAMLGIFGLRTAPKIRRVCDVRVGGVDDGKRLFGRAYDVGGAAGAGGVFERISGFALGGVHADGHGVMRHARTYQTHGGDQGLGACLAGEFPVSSLCVGDRADGLRHQRGGGLDRIRVRFRSDPDRAYFLRVDAGSFHGIARRLDGHGSDVFIEAGDGFLLDRKPALAAGPYTRDFSGGQAITRHIRAVADDAHGFVGLEQDGGGMSVRGCHFCLIYCIFNPNQYVLF